MPSNDSAVKHCMCLPLCRIIQYYVMREEAGTLAPSSSEQHKVSVRGHGLCCVDHPSQTLIFLYVIHVRGLCCLPITSHWPPGHPPIITYVAWSPVIPCHPCNILSFLTNPTSPVTPSPGHHVTLNSSAHITLWGYLILHYLLSMTQSITYSLHRW